MRKHILPILLVLLMVLLVGCSQINDLPQDTEISSSSVGEFSELKDNRLCAKEIIGNRANLTKWQDDFHACMVEQYPDLERGESASKTGRKHMQNRVVLACS